MKNIFLAILLCLSNYINAQSLNDQMWKFVRVCKESVVNPEFEGNNFDSLVDDARNGYLYIKGSWPTCGCSCENTVGAYKKTDNTYVLIKKEIWNCSWKQGIYSNSDLSKIFPPGFGIKTFTEKGEDLDVIFNDGLFYLDIEIPHIGTDTKIEIKLIPLGIQPKCSGGLCYDFSETNGQSVYLHYLSKFLNGITSNESLMFILAGRKEQMNPNDRNKLNEIIKESEGNYSISQLEMELKNVFFTYKTWQKLHYSTIILKWDKEKGRFVIKEKKGKIDRVDFLEFLKNAPWYSPVC